MGSNEEEQTDQGRWRERVRAWVLVRYILSTYKNGGIVIYRVIFMS